MKHTFVLFILNLIITQAFDNNITNGNVSNTTNIYNATTTRAPIVRTTTALYGNHTYEYNTTTTGRPTTNTIHPTTTNVPGTTTNTQTTTTEQSTTTHLRTTTPIPTTGTPTTTTSTATTKYNGQTTTSSIGTTKTTTSYSTTTKIEKNIIYCNNETWNSSCIQCIGPLCKFVEKGEQGIGLEILFVAAFISFMGFFALLFYKKYLYPILYKNIPEDIYFDSDESDFEDEAMPFTVDHIRKQSQSPANKLFEIVELREG